MKLTRVLLSIAVVGALSACSALGGTSSANSASPGSSVNLKNNGKSANTLQLFVGSTAKGEIKTTVGKGKKRKTTVVKLDQPVTLGDKTYYTSGPVIVREGIRSAFVAKTAKDQPALGLRFQEPAKARFLNEINKLKNYTVLAAINGKVFSSVDPVGSRLEDGVLLLPMSSLNNARDAADMLRK